MRVWSRFREVLGSFLVGFMVSFFVFQPYLYVARADIGSSISSMINESVNYAPPTFKEMGERGYVGFGSLSIRVPDANVSVRPFTFTPPFIKKGCGAIDIGWGGVNFLGFEYLVQKLQQILQAAPAFAFQLALEVFVPQVSQVLSKINAIADMINNINFDACKASSTLVHAVAPTLHDMIFNSRTDEAAQNESKGGGSFWDSLAKAFNLPPPDEIQRKFSDLINAFKGYSGDDSDPIKLLGNVGSFSVFKDKIALRNPEYAPPGSYLRFTGEDDYTLKAAFIGELSVEAKKGSDGNISDISVDFKEGNNSNIGDFVSQVEACIDQHQDDISKAIQRSLSANAGGYSVADGVDSLEINCQIKMPVNGDSSVITFDAGNTIIKPVLSSLVNYYFYISKGMAMDSTSAKWINFIASLDSGIVRAIRVAALAGGSDDSDGVVSYLGNIISTDLLKLVASSYVKQLVDEGCMEMQRVVMVLPKKLDHVISAEKNDSSSASSDALLKGIRDAIVREGEVVMQKCSAKSVLAGENVYNIKAEVYTKNREGLIKLAENLEKKLVQNLNSRGLGVLAKYVKVEL